MRRGLVRELESGERAAYDFAHAKVREAAYEATSLARRRLLHRRTADLLRADAATRDDLGRLVQIATHERAAGRESEAAEAFGEAASRARALHANREAATHLETALALGHPDVGGLQLALGEVRTALGDYPGAIAALETAAALATEARLATIEPGWAGSTAGAATWSPPTRTSSRPRTSSRGRGRRQRGARRRAGRAGSGRPPLG